MSQQHYSLDHDQITSHSITSLSSPSPTTNASSYGNMSNPPSTAPAFKSVRVMATLTFLQFCFAIYATSLLYFMSPSATTSAGPRDPATLASHIAHRYWKGLAGHNLLQQNRGLKIVAMGREQADRNAVAGSRSNPSPSIGAAMASGPDNNSVAAPASPYCEHEQILFQQKKPNDPRLLALKRELFDEIMSFQRARRASCETLHELLALPSSVKPRIPSSPTSLYGTKEMHDKSDSAKRGKPMSNCSDMMISSTGNHPNTLLPKTLASKADKTSYRHGPAPKITVILNHFKRKTLCAQLDALLNQTLPVHNVWVLAFGSPNEDSFRRIVESYGDPRISFVSSDHDFKYYGRFQMALQSDGADFVYIIDDDMIPGRKVVQILAHIAGTEKYKNSLLGSIGRILPFRQKDYTFPSYRKFGSKEAGIYLPDPAYDIVVDRMVQVDFLSSSWFLPVHLVKTIFVETPFTFSTGEDLHLSYQLQKYRDVGSFVVPIDLNDKETWADGEHRLAQISETTVIYKDVVQVRDDQWWRALKRGYITQWSLMHPQQIDALIYAHSIQDVIDFAPMIHRFRTTHMKKAFLVVPGGSLCPCEETAVKLGWPASVCHERRFKILDLEVGAIAKSLVSDISLMQEIYSSFKGLVTIHSPALILASEGVPGIIRDGIAMAISKHGRNTSLVFLPRHVIPHALWITNLRLESLQAWGTPKISVNIVTQNRTKSLQRLLNSLSNGYYLGDEITLSFNIDNKADEDTLMMANNFSWPHGPKLIRRRIIQGGLIRAVSESWYPASNDDYGLLLEDDIEVSPFYYMWLKYALLAYKYDPSVSLPELNAIALYTPRLIEVVPARPKWNATDFFKDIHPNMPYLHQLPCSWGALFFPKHWREFYRYMGTRYTGDVKQNPVKIPRSRTNGWQASWKKFLIDMMYLRGYVALYPNFPGQASFSTNHMEPGAHINAIDNVVVHKREDFEVPLLMNEDFWSILPEERLPPYHRLPVLNLFNQPTTLRGLKGAGSKLKQDVLDCEDGEVVVVDHLTGSPLECSKI